ncbi:MAG: hypothetical protein C4325_03730 [Blastocatellia bacterium]
MNILANFKEMEEILKKFEGTRIDVNCANGVWFRGENVGVDDAVLQLRDDERVIYIAVRRIIAISESGESNTRPGFVS